MGWNDHIDLDLKDRAEELKAQGFFEDKDIEWGVLQQVICQGQDSLTAKQRVVWRKGIMPILETPLVDAEEIQRALEKDWEGEARFG